MSFCRLSLFALGCALVALAIGSCEDSATSPKPSPVPEKIDPLDQTPRENYEAECLALHLSGELVAPTDLYELSRDALKDIRDGFRDSIPELNTVRFVAHWAPGEMLVRLTEEATNRFRGGTYHDLDSLNTYYRLTNIDTALFHYQLYTAVYEFEGRLHPERLGDAYSVVPSVERASPNHIVLMHDYNAYPKLTGDGIAFLFRYGWGDCPSGCLYNRFWFFKWVAGDIKYVGTHFPREEPAPDWWDEARVVLCDYYQNCN